LALAGCSWGGITLFPTSPPLPRPRAMSGYLSEQALAREGLRRPSPSATPQPAEPKLPAVPRVSPEEIGPNIKIERAPVALTPPPETEVITPAPADSERQQSSPVASPQSQAEKAAEQDGWERAPQWRGEAWGAELEIVALNDAAEAQGSGRALQVRAIAGAAGAKAKDKAVIALASPGAGTWARVRRIVLDARLSEGEDLGLAVGVTVGAQRAYYESKCRRLQKGWNRDLVYSLDEAMWKSAGSGWEHKDPVPAEEVIQVFLLLYPPPAANAVIFDNIRLGDTMPPAPSP
ncbi:MAG: hypothetical protein N3A66_10320, partial [Planctomycetota bacterium]|nr:hypothetical protein [Planctomycetota bacterium]